MAREVLPLQKKGGGRKSLSHAEGGGTKSFGVQVLRLRNRGDGWKRLAMLINDQSLSTAGAGCHLGPLDHDNYPPCHDTTTYVYIQPGWQIGHYKISSVRHLRNGRLPIIRQNNSSSALLPSDFKTAR